MLTEHRLVDPALERDEDPPAAWTEAAAALDEAPEGFRVMQLPGAEFGAFTWGYTVDPPLPGLSDRPLVTRDLLPLGSPAAMDLLYALDDRFQVGVPELAAVAPIARLFGADTVWLPADAAFDRFRTPRPELTDELFAGGGDGLGGAVDHGDPAVEQPNRADGRRAGTFRAVDRDADRTGRRWCPSPTPCRSSAPPTQSSFCREAETVSSTPLPPV